MLTQQDISKIRKVVNEEVENEISVAKDEIQSDITMSKITIQNDISNLKDRTNNIEIKVTKMHRELKEEIKFVSHILDRDNMKTSKQVKRIEEHLGFTAS